MLRSRLLLAVVSSMALLLATACNGGTEPGDVETPRPEPGSPTAEATRDESADVSPTEAALRLVPVADGFEAPLYATHAGDGTGRIFVVEQGGLIRIVENGEIASEPFLDISSRVRAGGEQGLLGLTFDPDYPDNNRFYVDYTDTSGNTVVARYEVTDRPGVADPSSEQVLLRIEQPYANHNGGHLAFGPDGYLYVATGDGGSGGDPHGNGQSRDTLLGKLLRIDVSGSGGYEIPSDNPFAGGGRRAEIWAYGLRNPWRFSFDRNTDDLWIGDVGQSAREEINLEPAGSDGGVNYGWNIMEGAECYDAASCDRDGLEEPVADYPHSEGISVTGGYVYRGERIRELTGGYLFGDFGSGTIWIIDSARPRAGAAVALETDLSISSFGEDEDGELFVVDHGGTLLRVAGEG